MMTTKYVTIGALALCSIAGAQEVREHKQVQVFTRSVAGPASRMAAPVEFMASEFGPAQEPVKGLPYSAEATSESTQTLADGNKISRKNTTQLYRDGEGRTRREETINAIGPWASGTPHRLIFVNDPVAQVSWVIDPQLKEARKMARSVTIERNGPEGATVTAGTVAVGEVKSLQWEEEGVAIGVGGTLEGGAAPGRRVHIAGPPVAAAAIPALPGSPGPNNVMFYRANSENAKTESLGKRIVEGVEAEGSKTTFTTPAGEIGNERPIVTESERWYSPELKLTVMTRYSDPRQGENIYKLTNISRSEPDPALFQPPSDYKVVEGGSQVIHMKKVVK